MNISKFCIQRKVTTLLAVIMISAFGLMFLPRLQMALMPDMEYPASVVYCTYVGATPGDIEELVTRPLESAVATVPGVDEIKSTSSENVSMVMVTYQDGTDLDQAAMKLREKFSALSLPSGCGTPIIQNMDVSAMMPVASVALTGGSLAELQSRAEEVVSPALERIDGVASVDVYGGVDNQIVVELDPARTAGYGLSDSYVSNFLAGQNLLYPGGDVQNGTQTLTVSTDAKFTSVEDIADMLLTLPSGGTIRLRQVADVYLESQEQDSAAKVDGGSCVILMVNKQSGANEYSTARAVESALDTLRAENPRLNFNLVYSAADYIRVIINGAVQNIILGVALAAVIVLLFLRRWGATLTIAVSMPFCILLVIVLIDVFGLTLNMMSLGGIAMGVGMIVDNSIVVLENIHRFAADGYSRMDACVEGTREVMGSITSSTLTTVAVFLPLGLSGGMTGMMFKDFSLTITFLLLGSLVIAVSLVPLLCYFMLDEEKVRRQRLHQPEKAPSRLSGLLNRAGERYLILLRYFVHHRKAGMLASVGLVVVFSAACLTTRMVLIPEMDQSMVSVNVSMPIGSQWQDTAAISDRVVSTVQSGCPELKSVYYQAQDESASIVVNLVDRDQRDRSSAEVAADLRPLLQDIAGCEITVSASSTMSMSGGDDIDVKISGKDYDQLSRVAGDLTARIAALEDTVDVTNSLSRQVPQVKVTVDRARAADYGLTAANIGAAVRTELTGATATTVTIGGEELDVVVRGSGRSAASLDALRSMPVTTARGARVPLSAVADVQVQLAPQSISRSNQSRQVEITGDTLSGDSVAMTRQIQAILDEYPMPEDCSAEIAGASMDMAENFGDVLVALMVALGLVYFILAAQFESFLMPVIVMMILPVSFSGALFGLPVTGKDLSLVSLVSLVMLTGTVVNASIILVDYINIRRRRGESREDAILNACPLRIRPVMMTSLTTILAMLPMAAGQGDNSELMSDMGVVMMFGMIISTVVTLLFTPVYYSVIDSLSTRFFHRRRSKPAPPAEAETPSASV